MIAEVRRFPDAAALTAAAADRITSEARDAVRRRGRFFWVLSGGRTPLPVYERLAGVGSFPWARTHVFWGDERCVPRGSPESNAGRALRVLLDRVPIPREQIHLPPVGAGPPARAAARWEEDLRRFFGRDARRPAFDLVLLGLGTDGHTASLFPGDPALDEKGRWTAAVEGAGASPPVARLTLTAAALGGARHALFLIVGSAKARLVRHIQTDPTAALRYPAGRIATLLPCTWYVAEG